MMPLDEKNYDNLKFNNEPILILNSMGTVIYRNKMAQHNIPMTRRENIRDYLSPEQQTVFATIREGSGVGTLCFRLPGVFRVATVSRMETSSAPTYLLTFLSPDIFFPKEVDDLVMQAELNILTGLSTSASANALMQKSQPKEDHLSQVLQLLDGNQTIVAQLFRCLRAYDRSVRGTHMEESRMCNIYELVCRTVTLCAEVFEGRLQLVDKTEDSGAFFCKTYQEELTYALVSLLCRLLTVSNGYLAVSLNGTDSGVVVEIRYQGGGTIDFSKIEMPKCISSEQSCRIGLQNWLVFEYAVRNEWKLKQVAEGQECFCVSMTIPRNFSATLLNSSLRLLPMYQDYLDGLIREQAITYRDAQVQVKT